MIRFVVSNSRLELRHQVVRRYQEELIVELSIFQMIFCRIKLRKLFRDVLYIVSSLKDLGPNLISTLMYYVPMPLQFLEQRFGPGLEEHFLSSKGGHDQVIYSLLRVRDLIWLKALD